MKKHTLSFTTLSTIFAITTLISLSAPQNTIADTFEDQLFLESHMEELGVEFLEDFIVEAEDIYLHYVNF